MNNIDLTNNMEIIVDVSQSYKFPEKWTNSDIIAKLFEEGGEFSEACMIKMGKLKTKSPETAIDDFLEAADMIICILDLLSKINPDMSKDTIINALSIALDTKTEKWIKKILEGY